MSRNYSAIGSQVCALLASVVLSSCACCGKPTPVTGTESARVIVHSGGAGGSMQELKDFHQKLKENLGKPTLLEAEVGCIECTDLEDGINLPDRTITYVIEQKYAKKMQCFANAWQSTLQKNKNVGLTLMVDALPTTGAACNTLPTPCNSRPACSGSPAGPCDRNLKTNYCDVCN
jgi:hypothetical protein